MRFAWILRYFVSTTLLASLLIILPLPPAFGQGFEEKEEKDQQEQIVVGQIAPDFTITDMNGEVFSLLEDAADMPIVLDFWATWCPPCVLEFPFLNHFQAAHADEVIVLGITSEEAESEQAIRDFVEERDIIFRVAHDPSREIMESYFVTGIPFVVVIGTDGSVIATHLGYHETIREDLETDLGLWHADYPPIPVEEEEEEEPH